MTAFGLWELFVVGFRLGWANPRVSVVYLTIDYSLLCLLAILPDSDQSFKVSGTIGFVEPGVFDLVHGGALVGGVVAGTGEMVASVGEVPGEFPVGVGMGVGEGDVHENFTGVVGVRRDGVESERDDIRGFAPPEVGRVEFGNGLVVEQGDGKFAPRPDGIKRLNPGHEPLEQIQNPVFPDRDLGLLVGQFDLHPWGTSRGGEAWR